ncbi:hypothetical protein D3C72_1207550 [compost metagenome]
MRYLRVGQGGRVVVDARMWHPGGVERRDPVGYPGACEAGFEQSLQVFLVGGPVARGGKARILCQLGHLHHVQHGEPQLVVARRNGKVAIGSPVGLVGRVARMRRAQPGGAPGVAEILAGLQRGDAERAAIHRHIDMRARTAGAHP